MAEPRVSVVVCSHERLRHVPAALASIAAQTLRGVEVLLVDDGSSPAAAASLRRLAAERPGVRLLRRARNGGPAAARNTGWAAARGRYLAWLDSDDVWYPRYLETALEALEADRRLAVLTADFDIIDVAGRTLARRVQRGLSVVNRPFKAVSGLPWVPKPSFTVVRRGAFPPGPPFDERFRRFYEDVDFFFRAAGRLGPRAFGFLDAPLAAYRQHRHQLTKIPHRTGAGRGLGPGGSVDGARMGAYIDALLARGRRLDPTASTLLLDLSWLGVKGAAGV